jgi:hypothetical protein
MKSRFADTILHFRLRNTFSSNVFSGKTRGIKAGKTNAEKLFRCLWYQQACLWGQKYTNF